MAEHFTKPIPPENIVPDTLLEIDIPKLGDRIPGKVRDSWIVGDLRVAVTTDRQSAYNYVVGTIPGKGQVLNLLSAYWFNETSDIIPNHMEKVPHPNVLVSKQAEQTLPVEVIVRRFMARSQSPTSIYHNYAKLGRREIYGIKFPDNLKPNQEFPMGPIVTPTTKSEADEELTDDEAREIVDNKLGNGIWNEAKNAALNLFERARTTLSISDIVLADTKYEFGLDKKGQLMLIDEVHTPDSSRYWLKKTYWERFEAGKDPQNFDKEILRRWLGDNGFTGEPDQDIPL